MTPRSLGDEWDCPYRGYELRINADGDVWWQVYDGTDRLYLDSIPSDLVQDFLQVKPTGGRVRVTEGGDVLTRIEEDPSGHRGSSDLDDYTATYVGKYIPEGKLIPAADETKTVPIRPDSLSTGDLWSSVYDGARFSFNMEGRVWWHDPQTKQRHPVSGGLPSTLLQPLQRLKPQGGSFRLLPWGDVITLVGQPATDTVREQFADLPAVVRNIIKLRRDRADLEMLPVYVGHHDDRPLDLSEPTKLTDELSDEESERLENWAASLGSTSDIDESTHTASDPAEDRSQTGDPADAAGGESAETSDADSIESIDDASDSGTDTPPTDDPVAWLRDDMERTEERIEERTE